ncbi:hypothetical protein RvY_14868 [Ramazzottius varieornatus]|uniref:Uncharacterized protein n=1 Tax=Ramazzottius varieornatus TaxID=947166 RepID=A0A1D1VUI6_RAMVA|nr:hypothetical protein RvY_14868 [Ramazzottius varieornatus]
MDERAVVELSPLGHFSLDWPVDLRSRLFNVRFDRFCFENFLDLVKSCGTPFDNPLFCVSIHSKTRKILSTTKSVYSDIANSLPLFCLLLSKYSVVLPASMHNHTFAAVMKRYKNLFSSFAFSSCCHPPAPVFMCGGSQPISPFIAYIFMFTGTLGPEVNKPLALLPAAALFSDDEA